MMMVGRLLLQASVVSSVVTAGSVASARGLLGDGTGAGCSAASFPTALNNTMCFGMKQQARNKMGAPIKTQAECLDVCCEDTSCTVYQ
jgi:hypothetical protein